MLVTRYLNAYPLSADHTLLINGLSGAVDIIDSGDLRLLDEPAALAAREDKAELVAQLVERGYLFSSSDDERLAFDRIRQVYEKLLASQSYRFTFVFNPTYLCNFACPYCFESTEMHTAGQVMTPRQVDLCFDAMHRITEIRGRDRVTELRGTKGLELFGGEPFLPPARPALARILEHAREEGFKIEAISNGYSLHRSRDLIEEYRELFDHFQITLDGPRDVHDRRRKLLGGGRTFDRIVANVDLLLGLGIPVAMRMNVDRGNVASLPEMLRFFEEKGWPQTGKFYWDMAPVTDHPQSGQVPDLMSEHEIVQEVRRIFGPVEGGPTSFRMFRVLKHVLRVLQVFGDAREEPFPAGHYCEANVFQFYCFGPDGYIYACPESINHSELAVGRFDPGFEIDDEKLASWGRTIFKVDKCRECSVAMFCGGGCAFASKLRHPETGEPVCDDAPAVLRTYVESIKGHLLEKYCDA